MSMEWESVRAYMDRLFRRSRESVETLAETLDRQAVIQRLAGQARGLVRERNQLLLAVGKKVYTLHLRGKVKNRDVLGDCRQIDQIRARIERLQEQIEEIRRQGAEEPELPIVLDDEELGDDEAPSAQPAPEAEAAPASPTSGQESPAGEAAGEGP